jgi:hypothetical protein
MVEGLQYECIWFPGMTLNMSAQFVGAAKGINALTLAIPLTLKTDLEENQ